MRYLTVLMLLFILWSCQGEPTQDKVESEVVTQVTNTADTVRVDVGPEDRTYVPGVRFGMVTASTTPAQLVEYYGEDNVRKDSIPLGKGYFVDGYTLFPDQPGEVALVYPNPERRVKDLQVTIDLNDTVWKSAQNGIGIGTTLEELERYNGRPVTFYGFDWDYGGVVTDWQDGGALKDHRVRLGYNFADRGKVALHPTIKGKQKVTSTSPYLKDLNIEVIQVIVRLP